MSDHTAIFDNYIIREDTQNDNLEIEHKPTGNTHLIDEESISIGDETAATRNEPLDFSQPHTKYADGLTDEEIWRVDLQEGEQLEIYRLQAQLKGGGTDSSFTIEIYDETNDSSLASTSDVVSANPINTSGDGSTVIMRITNDTGSSQQVSINANISIV